MAFDSSGDQSVFTLVYLSREAGHMSGDELMALYNQSRERNAKLGITGLLVHKSQHFLQVLEGGKDEVEEVMGSIAKDPRHTDVTVVVRVPDQPRRFARWRMAEADWPAEREELNGAYSRLIEDIRMNGAFLGPPDPIIVFLESLSNQGILVGK